MNEVNLIGGFYQAKSLTFSAQDTVNWLPVPSKSEAARSAIKLRGLPGLKPLFVSQILTSTLYPVVTVESIDSFGDVLSGQTFGAYFDAADSFGAITSGELRSALQLYDWPDEAVDSSGAITSGELRSILLAYDWPDEAVDSSGAINSGELRTILINYTDWPSEAVDSFGSITSGALA